MQKLFKLCYVLMLGGWYQFVLENDFTEKSLEVKAYTGKHFAEVVTIEYV